MKQRNLSKKLLATTLCVLFVLSITACGGNNSSSSNQENTNSESSNSEYTLSSFLENEPVIFYKVHEFNKDAKPYCIYYFNDGRITAMTSLDDWGKTIGELSEMEDEEIIESAIEAQKEYIRKQRQVAIEEMNSAIEASEEKYAEAMEELDDIKSQLGAEKYAECVEEIEEEYSLDIKRNITVSGGGESEGIIQISIRELLELTEELANSDESVHSSPYEIRINTDATGNNTETESICYAINESASIDTFPFFYDTENESGWFNSITFNSYTTGIVMPIYDTFYVTLTTESDDYLMARVDDENTYITVDEVGAKETVTDENSDEFKEMVAGEFSNRYEDFIENCPKIAALIGDLWKK